MNNATRQKVGFTLLAAMLPALAHAQVVGGVDPATIINNVTSYMLGPIGIGIAFLATIAVAVWVMVGRHSLELFVRYLAFLGMYFGATFVVNRLTGVA